jgi:hypothetical protein
MAMLLNMGPTWRNEVSELEDFLGRLVRFLFGDLLSSYWDGRTGVFPLNRI